MSFILFDPGKDLFYPLESFVRFIIVVGLLTRRSFERWSFERRLFDRWSFDSSTFIYVGV